MNENMELITEISDLRRQVTGLRALWQSAKDKKKQKQTQGKKGGAVSKFRNFTHLKNTNMKLEENEDDLEVTPTVDEMTADDGAVANTQSG